MGLIFQFSHPQMFFLGQDIVGLVHPSLLSAPSGTPDICRNDFTSLDVSWRLAAVLPQTYHLYHCFLMLDSRRLFTGGVRCLLSDYTVWILFPIQHFLGLPAG